MIPICEDCDRPATGTCNYCGLPFCGEDSTSTSGRLECLTCQGALHPSSAGEYRHPETDPDVCAHTSTKVITEYGTFDWHYILCLDCGARRPVHDDDDGCDLCLRDVPHGWVQ